MNFKWEGEKDAGAHSAELARACWELGFRKISLAGCVRWTGLETVLGQVRAERLSCRGRQGLETDT